MKSALKKKKEPIVHNPSDWICTWVLLAYLRLYGCDIGGVFRVQTEKPKVKRVQNSAWVITNLSLKFSATVTDKE